MIEQVTMYRLICDWPGCGYSAQDGESWAWAQQHACIVEAQDSEWWEGADGKSWYCTGHLVRWASDLEDGVSPPPRPYLLIHDGDASVMDDGTVTLVTA